jgi:UDP-N-acetylmuramyl pentapeptide synthase
MDTTLNGGWQPPEKAEKLDFIRSRVGEGIDFLPDRSMTLQGLCKAMGLSTDLPDRPITKLCVHSADLCYGALYFAFGPLGKADRRRAVLHENVIVTAHPDPLLPCIVVEDVAGAYKAAHALLRPWGDSAKVILVTGKENKTVTRELIAKVLETKGRVYTPQDTEHSTTAPWQSIHPSHDYCVLELQEGHPLGEDAIKLTRPDVVVSTDKPGFAPIPCPGLPFDAMAAATAAALEVGLAEGIAIEKIEQVIAAYAPAGYTTAKLTADDVNITIHNACKSPAMAESVLAAAENSGLKIAVTTPAYRDIFAPWAEKLFVVDEEHPLLAVEKELLEVLEDGASLVLCGDRCDDMAFLLRRLFGITDGFLYGGS